MRPIGFSSGALALGDFRRALVMLEGRDIPVLELSALRENELAPLLAALDEIRVEERFKFVSFHVPSKIAPSNERHIVGLLGQVAARGWPLIVHPTVLHSPDLWKPFEDLLCIENMDKRGPSARTCDDVASLFEVFPRARFCLDLGHARQIDPSMVEAYLMLTTFKDRLKEVHVSEVDFANYHARISVTARLAFQSVSQLIPECVPIVIESVLGDVRDIEGELRAAHRALSAPEWSRSQAQACDHVAAE